MFFIIYYVAIKRTCPQGSRLLERVDPANQESLETENTVDPMDAEQTWPTPEELAEADLERRKKIVKKVPKGTSEYQAAWIPDSDAGEKLFTVNVSQNLNFFSQL